jgi:cytidine deaminase
MLVLLSLIAFAQLLVSLVILGVLVEATSRPASAAAEAQAAIHAVQARTIEALFAAAARDDAVAGETRDRTAR